jgi:hypothetical protein
VVAWAALVQLADWTRQRLAILHAGVPPCPAEDDPLRPPAPVGSQNSPGILDLADDPTGAATKGPPSPQPDDRRAGHTTSRQGGGQ